jgi:hypothetical protein
MLNEERHSVPLDDVKSHRKQPDCWCQPDMILEHDAAVWLHHADSLLCTPGNRVETRTWRRRTRPQ